MDMLKGMMGGGKKKGKDPMGDMMSEMMGGGKKSDDDADDPVKTKDEPIE